MLAFLVASELGGNPFVAAFVGGLVFGASAPSDAAESIELTELTGGLLSLTLWFIFGAGFVVPALEQLDLATALYAVLSLTVIRMVPVVISLLGSSADRATVLFVGWFGPRGLASVVFALLAIEELGGSDPRVAGGGRHHCHHHPAQRRRPRADRSAVDVTVREGKRQRPG